MSPSAGVRALAGQLDDALGLATRARTIYDDLGLDADAAWASHATGFVQILAGDPAAAERELRPGYETLVRPGVRGGLPTLGALLAEAIYSQGRFEEAERVAFSIEELQPEAVVARSVRAKAMARLGRREEAERIARAAVASLDQTEFLLDRAEAHMGLAEVLQLAGKPAEAALAIETALGLYRQKGSKVATRRASALLGEPRDAGQDAPGLTDLLSAVCQPFVSPPGDARAVNARIPLHADAPTAGRSREK